VVGEVLTVRGFLSIRSRGDVNARPIPRIPWVVKMAVGLPGSHTRRRESSSRRLQAFGVVGPWNRLGSAVVVIVGVGSHHRVVVVPCSCVTWYPAHLGVMTRKESGGVEPLGGPYPVVQQQGWGSRRSRCGWMACNDRHQVESLG
jgi:hypothetical protein